MKTLVLFDIDGTILRLRNRFSRDIFAGLIKDIFGREVPFSKLPDFAGMTDLQILRETADIIGVSRTELEDMLPFVWKKMEESFQPYCIPEHIYLIHGAADAIKTLHKNKNFLLGLLTGNFEANAAMKLRSHGLDIYFPFGAYGSDNADRNQLPLLAIRRANEYMREQAFSSANTIIIGDTPRDIECAKVNSIKVIAVATGYYSKDELIKHTPNIVIESYDRFEEAVKILTE